MLMQLSRITEEEEMLDGNNISQPMSSLAEPGPTQTCLHRRSRFDALPVTGVTASKSHDLEFQASSIAHIENISSSGS